MYRKKTVNDDVSISKILSWILRHGALKEGFHISSDGYISLDEILTHKQLQQKCSVADIQRLVENNNKKRFTLRQNSRGNFEIKANQGHSIKVVSDLELESITSREQVKDIIHGTYYKRWTSIRKNGLSRMNRLHIHFASGLLSDKVISGMRSDAEVAIYLDVAKALDSGLEFLRSPNGVILSPGDANGIIETKYFLKVCDMRNGTSLSF